MKILYVIIMMLFLGMVSCSEDNLKGYSSSNCIQFDKLSKDSTVFSFAYDETLESGTVRVSFGHDASDAQTDAFLRAVSKLPRG